MMQLLVCAATQFEINPFKEFLRQKKISVIDLLITGIGMVATTYNLLKQINDKRPDFIIQAGIAGSFKPELLNTQVVYINKESIGDLGVSEHGTFRSVFDMQLADKNVYPFQNGYLINKHLSQFKREGISINNAVTINEITTESNRIAYYRDILDAGIESMEGAALHYVCNEEEIPYVQIRTVSNMVGERDKTKWKIGAAIDALNNELKYLVTNYFNL